MVYVILDSLFITVSKSGVEIYSINHPALLKYAPGVRCSATTVQNLIQTKIRGVDKPACVEVIFLMGEPTETDLSDAIKESLQKNGILDQISGQIRAAVMTVLNRNMENKEPPKVPEETKLINELLREYLEWNGYLYTEQVLAAESGQNGERMSRDVLTTKFGVMDDAKTVKIPLLYYVVAAFQNMDEE